jgi:hypothetical protein
MPWLCRDYHDRYFTSYMEPVKVYSVRGDVLWYPPFQQKGDRLIGDPLWQPSGFCAEHVERCMKEAGIEPLGPGGKRAMPSLAFIHA